MNELLKLIKNGELEKVKALLEDSKYSKQLDLTDALNHAISQNQTKIVYYLIEEYNVDINICGTNSLPLHVACMNWMLEMVDYLVQHDADVNAIDDRGLGSVHYAIPDDYYDDVEPRIVKIMEILVKNGADINIQDSKGTTPLSYAEESGYKKVVDYLVKCGKN